MLIIVTIRTMHASAQGIYDCYSPQPIDTLYGSPHDSIRFRIFFSRKWDDSHKRYTNVTHLIDYGDEVDTLHPDGSNLLASYSHLYREKGEYRILVQTLHDGILFRYDSALAIILDYTKPGNATKVKVAITGVEMNQLHVLKLPDGRDSVFLSTQRDFMFAWTDTDSLLYSDNSQVLRTNGSPDRRAKTRRLDAFASLSKDGHSILRFRLSSLIHLNDKSLVSERSISLADIPLKPGTIPSQEHAVYELTCTPDALNLFLHNVSFFSGDIVNLYIVNEKTIHYSPYSDITITVEFTK